MPLEARREVEADTERSLDRTRDPAVVEGQRGGHEEKVEDKHGGAHDLGHLPAGEDDAEEDEHEHAEEHHDGAAQPLA